MHRMLVPRLEGMDTRPPVARVVSAQTPDGALKALVELSDAPLAVVSDFNLKASINGLQLLARVRAARPDSVRVLFSGYSLEQLGDMEGGGDADAFLEKPLLLDDLIAPLSRVISQRLAGSA